MNFPTSIDHSEPSEIVFSEKRQPAKLRRRTEEVAEHRGVRNLIWVYFWLLLLEGALRKWFLPQLANPLLVVRDPVVIAMYLVALSAGIFPWNGYVIWSLGLAAASAIASLFAGQENVYVTLYGLRTDFLHLPLVFLIPKVFTSQDVEKVGRWLLITAIPMAILVTIQFQSSPSAWVNVGAGASVGGQMDVGFGRIRPPGVFSFTNGLAAYLSLVVAIIMARQLKPGFISSRLTYAAVPATLLMIAVSGSRTVLTSVVLIIAGVGYICLRKQVFMGPGVRAALLIGLACFLLQFRVDVREGMIVHENRVSGGGGVRIGLVDRILGSFLEPFAVAAETPWLGNGIGLGTTVAGGLIYGERSFILAENEWLRVVRESGPILGFAYLGLRVAILVGFGFSVSRALQEENPLPMILFFAIAPTFLNGQFGIPTILGFATFGAGLCKAALNLVEEKGAPQPFRISPESVTNPNRTVRGRSIYAENLHGRT